jgi:hypothetical protein
MGIVKNQSKKLHIFHGNVFVFNFDSLTGFLRFSDFRAFSWIFYGLFQLLEILGKSQKLANPGKSDFIC